MLHWGSDLPGTGGHAARAEHGTKQVFFKGTDPPDKISPRVVPRDRHK